jgi:hypothetical protein
MFAIASLLILTWILIVLALVNSAFPRLGLHRRPIDPFRPGLRHLMVVVVSIGIGCYLDLDSIRKLGRAGSAVTILCDIGLVMTALAIGVGRRLSVFAWMGRAWLATLAFAIATPVLQFTAFYARDVYH